MVGLLEQATNAISDFFDPTSPTDFDSLEQAYTSGEYGTPSELWTVSGEDWAKVFAYQFIVRDNSSGVTEDFFYTLPIPPQQYMVKPVFATRATATVGGVVEEVSPVTFWMINMAGTPGTGVGRELEDRNTRNKMATQFRDKITTTGLLSGIAASANAAIATVGGVGDTLVDTARNVAESGNPLQAATSVASGVTGAINTALIPPLPYSGSAVSSKSNGFIEMQAMIKFLHIYQKLKNQEPSRWSLHFADNKTGQEWRIVIKDMNVQRSAQQPFLYRYNLTMQGWGLKGVDERPATEFDRFGPTGDLAAVNSMTFNTMSQATTILFNNISGEDALDRVESLLTSNG